MTLDARPCHCGAHYFALPYDAWREVWKMFDASPYRALAERNGNVPLEPRPSPHVILVSPQDAVLLQSGRWRVWRTKNGQRNRFLVARNLRGMPLAKLIKPSTPERPVLVFVNRDGTDCRRENLRATTRQEIADERRAKRREKVSA